MSKHEQKTPVPATQEHGKKPAASTDAAPVKPTPPTVLTFSEGGGNMGWGKKDIPIPATHNTEKQLLKLTREDFPRTKEGKTAYAEYQVQVWTARKAFFAADVSDRTKVEAALAREEKKLEALRAKLAAMK